MPLIGQLLERWTEEAEQLWQLLSIGRWFNSGRRIGIPDGTFSRERG